MAKAPSARGRATAGAARTTMLSRSPGIALHRQLFVIVRQQIVQGVYRPGEAIPVEDELCRRFGVSKITVRRAISDLVDQGLLEKHPGRGTFVKRRGSYERSSATLNFVELLKKSVVGTRKRLLSMELEAPPANIAHQLDIGEGEPAMKSMRLHLRSVPLLLTTSWVHADLGKRITRRDLRKTALSELLMDRGVTFGRVVQEFTAEAAQPEVAKLLSVDVGTPLIKIFRLLYDDRQRPVQHLTAYVSPERSRIVMDIAVGDVNTLATGALHHDVS